MRCALYGKLPAKRDFVALYATRAFLAAYEPWLQGGISASRLALGDAWQGVFLNAPIWRFWLGADLTGGAVAGAFMPSVDGVGRYFPLTVLAQSQPGGSIPPPELDPQEAWYATIEDFLLATLDPDMAFEAITQALDALAPASDRLAQPVPEAMTRLSDGTILTPCASATFPQRLAELRQEDHARAYAGSSFFWTVGGDDYAPLALVCRGLPDPHLFAGLLTGHFDLAPAGLSPVR
jgi:type VI secretion system protein ImpM